MIKLKISDMVKYKSRNWIIFSINGDRAVLKLAQGQKPYIYNYNTLMTTDLISAKLSNLKICEKT